MDGEVRVLLQSFGPWVNLLRYVGCVAFYRDLKDIIAERSVDVDHATLNWWLAKFSTLDLDRSA